MFTIWKARRSLPTRQVKTDRTVGIRKKKSSKSYSQKKRRKKVEGDMDQVIRQQQSSHLSRKMGRGEKERRKRAVDVTEESTLFLVSKGDVEAQTSNSG